MVSNSSNSSAQSVHRRYSLLVLTTCYHHHLPPPTYYYLTDLTAFPRISTTYYTTTRHPIPSHPIPSHPFPSKTQQPQPQPFQLPCVCIQIHSQVLDSRISSSSSDFWIFKILLPEAQQYFILPTSGFWIPRNRPTYLHTCTPTYSRERACRYSLHLLAKGRIPYTNFIHWPAETGKQRGSAKDYNGRRLQQREKAWAVLLRHRCIENCKSPVKSPPGFDLVEKSVSLNVHSSYLCHERSLSTHWNEWNIEQSLACTHLRRKSFSYILASSWCLLRWWGIIQQSNKSNRPTCQRRRHLTLLNQMVGWMVRRMVSSNHVSNATRTQWIFCSIKDVTTVLLLEKL